MKIDIIMKKDRIGVEAYAQYDTETKETVVLKGSLLSENISQAKTFRGAKSIIKFRDGVVGEDNRLVVDVTFKSSSTAGNFVTGRSTDGPGSWNTLDGKRLKDML